MKKRLKRYWTIILEEFALFSAEFITVLIIGFISVVIFIKFANRVVDNNIAKFDDRVTLSVKGYASEGFTMLMKSVTFMGNREFIIFPAFLIFFYFLFIKKHRWYSIKIPVVALGSISINLILKHYFARPRPLLEHMVEVSGKSFPSGHAMFNFSFYGLLIYIVWEFVKNKPLKYALVVILMTLIFLIGISRIYLGVHYPSDVIAGFCAGLIWLVTSILLIKGMESYVRRKANKLPPVTPITENPNPGNKVTHEENV